MEKKILVLVCFFSALTLIVSISSSALVFYNEQARTEANSNKVLATNNIYKSNSIVYNQTNTYNLSGIAPGYTSTHTFSITNNNSNTTMYKIVWENVTSTWGDVIDGISHPEEFVYSVTCSNGEAVKSTQMPINRESKVILDNLELKTNKTNECTLKVEYIKTGLDQSYNNNKSFRGTYKVIVKE